MTSAVSSSIAAPTFRCGSNPPVVPIESLPGSRHRVKDGLARQDLCTAGSREKGVDDPWSTGLWAAPV